jgi:hypothetical protein
MSIPTNLPNNPRPWKPSNDRHYYVYGNHSSQKFRYDGHWHMCHFNNCLYVEKCCRSFVGRRHFQQYHAYPRETDNQAILASARLVPEALARLARAQWLRTRATPPPFNDNGLPNVVHQAIAANNDDSDDNNSSEAEDDTVCKLSAARAINHMGIAIYGQIQRHLGGDKGEWYEIVQQIVANAGDTARSRLKAYAEDHSESEESNEGSDDEDLGEVERRQAEAAIDKMIQSITDTLQGWTVEPTLSDCREVIRNAAEAAKTSIGLAGTEGV